MSGVSDRAWRVEENSSQVPETKKTVLPSILPEWFVNARDAVIWSVMVALAALNPISEAKASPITTAPISWPQKAWANPLLTNVALNNWVNYDVPLDSSTLSHWLQKSLREVSDRFRQWEKDWILTIESLWDPKLRTWIKWPQELWKRIPFIAGKEITTWSFEALTWLNLDEVLRDMRTNLWKMKADELKWTLTWKFIQTMFAPMIKEDPKMAKTMQATLKNFSWDKWWAFRINEWILDGKAYEIAITEFELMVRTMQQRWILTPDTLYYAFSDAWWIAYQTSLRYKEVSWKPEFTWKVCDPSAPKDKYDYCMDAVKTWMNMWIDWRRNLATAVANRDLVTKPESEALVFSSVVTFKDGERYEFQTLVPKGNQELWTQALSYWILADRSTFNDLVKTEVSRQKWEKLDQEIAQLDKDIAASKERWAAYMKSWEENVRQFIEIANWKLSVEELKPKLPKIIIARNSYVKAWANPELLAQLDAAILRIDPNAKKEFEQLAQR